MLMPRKVVSICTICRGGDGGGVCVCSSRVTVKTPFCSLAVGQTISFACLTSVIFKELQCNLKHCSDENVFRTNRLYFFFSQL